MDIDKPTHRILLRAHTQVAEGDVAEYCEGQQTDQGDVDFNVQKVSLGNGGAPVQWQPLNL